MSEKRQKLSGHAYRKNAKEKAERIKEELKHMPKIQRFFSNRGTAGGSVPVETEQVAEGQQYIQDNTTEPVATSAIINANEEANIDLEFSSDPVDWDRDSEKLKDYLAINGITQNKNADFSLSARKYSDRTRSFSNFFFKRKLLNGELRERTWLVYSEKAKAVFCAPCLLLGSSSAKCQLAQEGFSDWKNASVRLREHEDSEQHKTCFMSINNRNTASGKMDNMLVLQQNNESEYWRNVLRRVVAVVKALSSRGLAFRGTDESFGSQTNGNYLMLLELIAEFDPFMKEHIKRYGNAGSGTASYLSKTVCYEFIEILSVRLLNAIIVEVKDAKYYSISVDSTPDVSHVDQLAFIIRYVNDEGVPVERFIKFIPHIGHKAQSLFQAVSDTLEFHQLDLQNCRGQSYDNASNMAGPYSGLQARFKEQNPLAIYIPCSAHSLNLVGTCAAESCVEAVSFFGVIQQLYNFFSFSASTSRWEVLTSHLNAKSTVKNLSVTRWSARSDACRTLRKSWTEIIEALEAIEDDDSQRPVTRSEAAALLKSLNCLETAFMTVFWNSILEPFNATNKHLQSADVDISAVVKLYGALLHLMQSYRNEFERFESEAKELSGLDHFKTACARARNFFFPFDVSQEGDVQLNATDHFRVNTFFAILDKLNNELQRRSEAYEEVYNKFNFLEKLTTLETSDIQSQASNLRNSYPDDLEPSFPNECLYHCSYLKNIHKGEASISELYKTFKSEKLHIVNPNIDIAMHIYLCTLVTNCSAERSFSCLKRVKNYLRSSLGQERLNSLAVLAIESELLNTFSYEDVIDEFAKRKVRAKKM
ncbi:zinc finger MYM-type protein 1-like [Rana temporaria]|uniref:zinc finger MYM-type protein 1-like n=1 Tax=Rana temporaria TaxID=8407 RepID=UPI001AADA389|nr:zinc finger MYM-type protein 1-like [Rana temporaria]